VGGGRGRRRRRRRRRRREQSTFNPNEVKDVSDWWRKERT